MVKKNTLLLLTLSLVLILPSSSAQQREVKPVQFERLSDRLYEITEGRGARGGVYIGDDAVLVIDAKQDRESVDQVIEGIKELTDRPIKYLVSTHSDGDHVTGNRFYPKTTTFVAHENCRREFFHPRRDGTESEWNKPELAPFLPSVTFSDKKVLSLGSENVELWYFGVGHTTGDTVVYFPEEKTAFIGDQIFVERPQLIHSYKGGNSFEHVKTLTKMLGTLDAERFQIGHGDGIGRDDVKKHIAQVKEYQEEIDALVKEGKTLDQVKAAFEESEGRLVESIFNEIRSR